MNLGCDPNPGGGKSGWELGQGPEAMWGPYLSPLLSRLSWLSHVALGTLKVEDRVKGKLRQGNPVICKRWYGRSCWSRPRWEHLRTGSDAPESPGGPHQALADSLLRVLMTALYEATLQMGLSSFSAGDAGAWDLGTIAQTTADPGLGSGWRRRRLTQLPAAVEALTHCTRKKRVRMISLLSKPLHVTGVNSFLPLCFLTHELLVKDAKVVK